uniref:Trafficking protein particle complex subunit 9 n=1 Tax=Elaeophora elaphi TaxID=1147741 RepID=A0A0R3RQZ3_9BILA
MLEASVPMVEDHCRVLIYVKQFGPRSPALFNCLLERLQRVRCLQGIIHILIKDGPSISDNPKRIFVADFTATISTELVRFGELQAHRRIIGFIGVVQASIEDEKAETSQQPSDVNTAADLQVEHSKMHYFAKIKEQYDSVKTEYASTVVDSRCIVIGYPEESMKELCSSRELFYFKTLDDADSLEIGIRDFLRSIYYVLESRRLDLSFEKMECPPCPALIDEQKYRQGLENKTSKIYRKKCIGRLRKQVADYTLMTGLPTLAMDSYQSAIEFLKQANDLLWLAAAYEGWACAAMIAKYDLTEECASISGIQRVSTITFEQILSARKTNQYGTSASSGHQRYWSDEECSLKTLSPLGEVQLLDERSFRQSFRFHWSGSTYDKSGKYGTNYLEIVERFKTALESYERFSFAAWIEYECMMKTASVFRYQRLYVDMESFIREHIGKYLDDSFNQFGHFTKALICLNSAEVYHKIGFNRKCAFFARLGVLFRLHMAENGNRNVADYRQVYPILYRTLTGYGMPENPKEFSNDLVRLGPIHIQRRALHEVFMSALRAEYYDAAIRHLCYILQVYYDYMDQETSERMLGELTKLVASRDVQHQLSQHISLPQHGLIIPPIQMTRFPKLEKFAVCPLPGHLAATIIRPKLHSDIFIYSPFQHETASKVTWIQDCACEVSVSVTNCLPCELSVSNLALLSEGCAFEPIPVRLTLPACGGNAEAVDFKLIGVPRQGIGTAYYYWLFVRDIGRTLRDFPERIKSKGFLSSMFDIEILPALPVLELKTSLSRAPISEDDVEPTAEITVYSGQTFEHSVSLVNTSETITIKDVNLVIRQPKVCGGPCMIEIASTEWLEDNDSTVHLRRIEPLERKQIKFRIFGIDPSAMAEDGPQKERNSETEVSTHDAPSSEETHDRIPFTGRLLTCEFVFYYRADIDGPNGEQYERRCRLPLAVSIVPAVTVAAWHVLPGDGPTTRYVVVDVTNNTEWDAELTYGKDRVIGVQPKEFCRVPLLCKCCSEVASNAFQEAASRASHMMQMQEMERLRQILERHVSWHLDIRWSISSSNLSGSVPVGPLLSSVSLLKQLVVPVISVQASVNGTPFLSDDEITVGIGEIFELSLSLITPTNDDRSFSGLIQLQCYRDLQNGSFIESNDNMIILNTESVPFRIMQQEEAVEIVAVSPSDTISIENDYAPAANFVNEPVKRVIRPLIMLNEKSPIISPDELFCCAISFNVITKVL